MIERMNSDTQPPLNEGWRVASEKLRVRNKTWRVRDERLRVACETFAGVTIATNKES